MTKQLRCNMPNWSGGLLFIMWCLLTQNNQDTRVRFTCFNTYRNYNDTANKTEFTAGLGETFVLQNGFVSEAQDVRSAKKIPLS